MAHCLWKGGIVIYGNAQLHNVAELVDEPGLAGGRIQRVPESTRVNLEEPARLRTQNPDGCEIRFVLEGDSAEVTLSAKEPGTTVTLFFGPFHSRQQWLLADTPTTISVSLPHDGRMRSLPTSLAEKLTFAPQVCRLSFYGRGIAVLHDIAGDIRPPTAAELPERTILAYGTSITHGAAAGEAHLTWVAQTAWRLGTDALNLGVGGACLSEPAFGDFIASRDDWDLAILSLSVNMIGRGFTPREFRERVGYVVSTVASSHPEKPVACVSIYPYFGDWESTLQPNARGKPQEFRDALRSTVADLDLPNLHYIDGPTILDDISGLTADMIHPSDLGMIRMGENMARALRSIV